MTRSQLVSAAADGVAESLGVEQIAAEGLRTPAPLLGSVSAGAGAR
jgi:hypothetical protein